MLYIKIDDASQLREMFIKAGRDSFSYEGYAALLEYYEEFDGELDIIAMDCEWREASADDIISDYGEIYDEIDEDDEDDVIAEKVRGFLQENTYYVELQNGNFLFGEF